MEDKPTEVRPYTTNYGRQLGNGDNYVVDLRTALYVIVMILLVEAFTLGIVLITWKVIGNG